MVLFLLVLCGRIVPVFVRTSLPVIDLLIAGVSLLLLAGTGTGISLHMVAAFYPYAGSPDLAGSLWTGMAIITNNGALALPLAGGQVPPLMRVIILIGMIGGFLLFTLIIGKIGARILKKADSKI